MALISDAEASTKYAGHGMNEICENHFDTKGENHCAHFVSHALGIKFPVTCGDLKFSTKGSGATIRWDELFNQLNPRGLWDNRPTDGRPLLIFVTFERNVINNRMGSSPHKHVGIYINGPVYNFSNSRHVVIRSSSAEEFHQNVGGYYTKMHPNLGPIGLYYGVPPL
jgi:hypothetical protein